MGLPDNTDKKSFMDRLDEDLNSDTFLEQMSGDESEEDGNAIATESDFEGYIFARFVYVYAIYEFDNM